MSAYETDAAADPAATAGAAAYPRRWLAAVLIIAGSFGDLFGRKRVFLAGIAGFGVVFLAAAVLSLMLPRTAVAEEHG